MNRYPIHTNYDQRELPIGIVELKEDIPNYAVVNGAIVPMVRLIKNNPDEASIINFGLVLRKAVDINRPYIGDPGYNEFKGIAAISREDDDPIADTRISIGTPKTNSSVDDFYFVFRGDPEKVIEVLERVFSIAKVILPGGHYTDHRRVR